MDDRYGVVRYNARKAMGISLAEYVFCDIVYHLSSNPAHGGWATASNGYYADIIGITDRGIRKLKARMIAAGLVERNENDHLRTSQVWYDTAVEGRNLVPGGRNLVPAKAELSSANNNKIVIDIDNTAFAKFWNAYGYKKDRRNAEKAWKKLTADEKEKALTCAPIYASDTVLEDRPGREWKPRRKFPATWLNAKGWEEYEERAAERSEADAGPTPYDEQYAKYLEWASSFQLITAAVKYLSKRQFCEYKERDYRMTDNLRWQLLRQAHERFEAGDTATPDVFTLYSDMAAARQKQAQTI